MRYDGLNHEGTKDHEGHEEPRTLAGDARSDCGTEPLMALICTDTTDLLSATSASDGEGVADQCHQGDQWFRRL